MNQFIYTLQKQLNSNLQSIDQKSIVCIKNTLSKLKTFILNYTFKNEDEEILFFKVIKRGIVSQLIYHVKINSIENKRPIGSFENRRD